MQINLDDVLFSGKLSTQMLMESLAKNELSSDTPVNINDINAIKEKYSKKNIMNSEHSFEFLCSFVSGCIEEYHDQLRKILLEKSIDIGELDIDSTGDFHLKWILSHSDTDE
ncbi:MAG: hypothetical protein IJN43_14835 [Ruminococcus sp.]|nr:hypothetical protein [Ruminococcus sp.]